MKTPDLKREARCELQTPHPSVDDAGKHIQSQLPEATDAVRPHEDKDSVMQSSEVVQVPLSEIKPSPENDKLYRPVDPDDPATLELAESMRKYGVLEPLVLTRDNYILSGHRRFTAARVAGLSSVPVRYESVHRGDDPDAYVARLREYNRQREKTLSEKLREEIASIDPDDAHQSILNHREEAAEIEATPFTILGKVKRKKISTHKLEFLEAAIRVAEERRHHWPLSVRQIHYALLNDPPLKYSSRPKSRYDNSDKSYRALVDLLARARVQERFPFHAISDDTRPVTQWRVYPTPQPFIRKELKSLLQGYQRNLQQSQPNHIEIVGEKNTVGSILRPVASDYRIPLTISRGFCSLDPRRAMAERYWNSGKQTLIVLICSDHDPDGEEIAQSLARSMRDDFGIEQIHPVKVALTREQALELNLPNALPAKIGSSNYRKFLERYGDHGWELESLPPETLQDFLRDSILSVMDLDAYNAEVEQEKQDAVFLQGLRRTITGALSDLKLDNEQGDG